MQYANTKIDGKSIFWICVLISGALFYALFSEICFPFICGFILAYIFSPLVDYLSKYKYVNRTFFSMLFAAVAVMIFALIVVWILPKLTSYLTFLHEKIPEYYSLFIRFINDKFSFVTIKADSINDIQNDLQKYLDQNVHILASIAEQLAVKGKEFAKFCSFFVIMPVSFFYFLKDWNASVNYICNCIPIQQRKIYIEITGIIRKTVSSFLYWQFYIVFTLFAYYAVTLRLISVEHNLYLAFLSGLMSFIPFIGCLFSCFLVVFISIPVLTISKLYFIIAIYFVGQFIEGYVLYPHFIGKKTGLHPLWILFSFFAGAELDGVVGIFIAIPSAAVIRSLCVYALRKFRATQAYKQ